MRNMEFEETFNTVYETNICSRQINLGDSS